MSQAAYPILDADGHITESLEQVARYLDAPYNQRPLNFSLYPWDGWDRRLLGTLGDTAGTADAWLRALDRGGMEQAVLYPTLGLFLSFLKDRAWAVALCRAYNTFLHEEFVKKSPRLHAVALLPVQDPDAAARELRRAVTELGLVGAMLAADGSHLLGDSRFLPIYEEADRLDVMLGIHASGSHLGGAGVDLFPQFIQAHTCSHAFGQMRQITSMVFEGIPERFPRLRIAYLEAGCGWAPYWAERMDDEYAKRAAEAPALTRKPSDYIRSGSIFFSCEADEWLLPQALKLIGENQIVYASDFPHWDHSYPASLDEIRERGDITDLQKRKILSDNTRRLYGLKGEPDASAPVALIGARKKYGDVEALRGVDLTIRAGEVVAMLGPNGAGKTTSISLMLGLRQPTAGQARLFGLPPTDRRARSRCGVMLQESGTTSVLTVREIVDVFRTYYPAPLPVERAIAMAGLTEQVAARIGTLSGGQRQRLYFALAICGDPDILFLDEPTVGMDVEARRAFTASIQTLSGAGKTIVFTTHYLREAEELARRIIVIDRGAVIADASPQELKARVPGKKMTLVSGRPFAPADLDGLPARVLTMSGGRASLLSNEPAAVLRELFRRGVDVVDLEVTGADLEEAFLALTRRAEGAS